MCELLQIQQSIKKKTHDLGSTPPPQIYILKGLLFPQVVSQCLQIRTHLFLGWSSLICKQSSGHLPFSPCRCALCSLKSQWGRTHLGEHTQYSGIPWIIPIWWRSCTNLYNWDLTQNCHCQWEAISASAWQKPAVGNTQFNRRLTQTWTGMMCINDKIAKVK